MHNVSRSEFAPVITTSSNERTEMFQQFAHLFDVFSDANKSQNIQQHPRHPSELINSVFLNEIFHPRDHKSRFEFNDDDDTCRFSFSSNVQRFSSDCEYLMGMKIISWIQEKNRQRGSMVERTEDFPLKPVRGWKSIDHKFIVSSLNPPPLSSSAPNVIHSHRCKVKSRGIKFHNFHCSRFKTFHGTDKMNRLATTPCDDLNFPKCLLTVQHLAIIASSLMKFNMLR